MLKLSFSTLPVMGMNAAELTALCHRHGMQAEIRLAPDNSFPYSPDLPIVNLGSGICLRGYDRAQVATAKVLLEKAKEAGIAGVRVFLGNFCVRRDAPRAPIDRDGCVRALKELCSVGVGVWVETHNEYATSAALLPLMQDVGEPNIGIIWDVVHPIEDGEDIYTTYKNLKPYIRQIHVKDAKPHPDPMNHDWYYTKLGEGELPIAEVVRLTREGGYEGTYSFEWEEAWRAELKGVYTDPDTLLQDFRAYMEAIQ